MRVYVASSWRNARHPSVVEALRAAGHDVYDYRNPPHGEWSATDQWWKRPGYAETTFPTIINGEARRLAFDTDMDALRATDAVVLVLDSGKSAHLEAGFAAGAGKLLVVLGEAQHEPELMYAMARFCVLRVEEVVAQLASAPAVYADRPEDREVYRSGDPALTDRDRLLAFAAELDELDRTWASTPLAAERAALVRRAIDAMDRADGAEAERDALRAAVRAVFTVGSAARAAADARFASPSAEAEAEWERTLARGEGATERLRTLAGEG